MHLRSLSTGNGDGMSITITVIGTVCFGLATVAVGIRLWSRKIQRHSLVLSDYAAMLAWVFSAIMMIMLNISIVQYGTGEPMASMKPTDEVKIVKVYMAGDAVWAATNTSIKISIVHFYITIFRSNKIFLKFAYAVMSFVSALGVAITISTFLICRPLSKAWDPSQPGVCENALHLLIFFTSGNMATDLMIILLPMPMVWRLQMATRRKIELTIIFALGFLVCVVSMIRLVVYSQINLDDLYTEGWINVVTLLEPLLGIVVACLPLFPPAIKKVVDHMRKTKSETRNVLSSSMARLRMKRSKSSAFQSLGDSSPLTDLEVKGTRNRITGPGGKSDGVFGGDGNSAGFRIPPQSSIMVERELEVRSDDAKYLQGK